MGKAKREKRYNTRRVDKRAQAKANPQTGQAKVERGRWRSRGKGRGQVKVDGPHVSEGSRQKAKQVGAGSWGAVQRPTAKQEREQNRRPSCGSKCSQ
jgi:hypothetical protein